MVAASVSLESLCVNSIRMLAVDAVNKSNSGHPGLPMGCAPMGYALWQNILNHNPNNPKWFNRDRFVLSAGHGCMLLYSLLHLTGYKSVSIEAVACILSLTHNFIPPTINYVNPDPECDLDYVPNNAREAQVGVALSNSFGFGGHNVCLAFSKMN